MYGKDLRLCPRMLELLFFVLQVMGEIFVAAFVESIISGS
jgi:hypothetical protein